MRINEEKLLREIKELQRNQFRTKSLTSYAYNEIEIESIRDIYERIMGKKLDIKTLENPYYKVRDKDHLVGYAQIPAYLYFQNQKECTSLATKVLDTFEEEEFYDALMVDALRTLKEKEILEILRDFLGTYDERLLKLFNELYDNECIDLANEKTYDMSITRAKFTSDETYIIVGRDLTIYSAESICHELGHARSVKEFHRRCKKQLYCDQVSYFEMYPTFLELTFIDYLKKNRILMRDTTIMENEVFASIYSFFQDLENASNFTVEERDYDIISYIKKAYIYSYGFIIALLLHERYLESPNEIKKLLDNYIFSSGLILPDEQLEMLDITKEDMMDTKILRKRLQKHNEDIKKYVMK